MTGKTLLGAGLALAVLGAAAAGVVLRPQRLPAETFAGLTADAGRGAQVFWAGGCASCHAAANATGDAKLLLAGGEAFPSPFGTFYAPNISTDQEAGIGGWSVEALGDAMMRGVSPEGSHYYPAFPFVSYAKATPQDIVDLHAFLATLPADPTPSKPHDLRFPFNIRLALGGWKFLFFDPDGGPVLTGKLTPEEERGRYLVEGLGHCAECHTPRNRLGAMEQGRWLAGGPKPDGKGSFPNITPAKLDWSAGDIVEYLRSGFTPEYDSAGGQMALVIENTAQLPESDRAAIAAYLKKVPAAE